MLIYDTCSLLLGRRFASRTTHLIQFKLSSQIWCVVTFGSCWKLKVERNDSSIYKSLREHYPASTPYRGTQMVTELARLAEISSSLEQIILDLTERLETDTNETNS